MAETPASRRLRCPRCGETVLPEDKFCFHCGRRLELQQYVSPARKLPRWIGIPAALAVVALAAAGYDLHRQSLKIAHLQTALSKLKAAGSTRQQLSGALHPVVTTTTTYPAHMPSSANWTLEVETYKNVHFAIRVPTDMNSTISGSTGNWVWGQPRSPYEIMLSVVSAKPASASTVLGANTYGTAITESPSTASQALYVNWAPNKWVEVSMIVPASHWNWLGSIATSLQIS